jgi:hypothetical protein
MAAEKSSPVSITGKISFTMRILALAGVRAVAHTTRLSRRRDRAVGNPMYPGPIIGTFTMTDFLEPFAVSGPDAAMKIEYQQGVNMAKAALRIPTLEHYIWSVLPNSAKGLGWEARRAAFCCEEQDRRVHPVESGITRKDDILLYHVLREQSAIPRLRADQS